MASCGDAATRESLAATALLRQYLPALYGDDQDAMFTVKHGTFTAQSKHIDIATNMVGVVVGWKHPIRIVPGWTDACR
jgi:hypothetical protein